MNIEKMLINYNKNIAIIKNLELSIEEIQGDYETIKSIDYSAEKIITNSVSSNIENLYISKEKEIEKLNKYKRSKEIEIERVNNLLNTLSGEDRKLIQDRYFLKYSVGKIAERIEREYNSTHLRIKRILKELEEVEECLNNIQNNKICESYTNRIKEMLG